MMQTVLVLLLLVSLIILWQLVASVSTQTIINNGESCILNQTCWINETITTTENVTDEFNLTMTVNDDNDDELPEIIIKEETLRNVLQVGCFCDLQRNVCEINCCCDNDCDYESKLAFSYCKQEKDHYVDTRFCNYMEYVYKNNTLYQWQVNQNGLFCVVRNNLPAQYAVQQKTEIKTLENALLQSSYKYVWPADTIYNKNGLTLLPFNFSEKFQHGKTLLVVKNNAIVKKFVLPTSFITNNCARMEEIKFLENFKSKCSHYRFSEALKPETYFKNLTIISITLRFKNISTEQPDLFQSCPGNICIGFNVKVCGDDFKNCQNFTEEHNTWLVRKIKYNIYHNGTSGIRNIDLFLVLEKITFQEGFYQDYQVNFYWLNYTLNYSSVLSGNPGYKNGKQILIGSLLTYSLKNNTRITGTNLTEYNRKYYRIVREHKDIVKNFLVFPANSDDGFCTLNNYSHVKVEFGYNSIFKCRFSSTISNVVNRTPTSICNNIQKYIFEQWSVTYNRNITKVVGRFGNADSNNIGEWLKILENKPPSVILTTTSGYLNNSNKTLICKKIVNQLSVIIFHSRIDTKYYSNQEKIVGLLYKYGIGKDFYFTYQENQLLFDIPNHVDVVFIDSTKPKVRKFVEPPTLKIRLPYDFFYPFIKVYNRANYSTVNNVLFTLLLVVRCFIVY